MSYNSGSNRARNFKSASRDYSLNCTPLGPITIANHERGTENVKSLLSFAWNVTLTIPILPKPKYSNRSFPSSLVPLVQNESKCEAFHMKMSSACSFIFIRMVSRLDSLWNKGTKELGNGVLRHHHPPSTHLSPHKLNTPFPTTLSSLNNKTKSHN